MAASPFASSSDFAAQSFEAGTCRLQRRRRRFERTSVELSHECLFVPSNGGSAAAAAAALLPPLSYIYF